MPKTETGDMDNAVDLDAESAVNIDDDVVDLLEVVKSGKRIPPLAGEDDSDFSADLDSMLDTLSKAEKEHDNAVPGAFPDPTPVDYEVDYNESLDLPGMKDLDAMFDSLGAGVAAGRPAVAYDNPELDGSDLAHASALDHLDVEPVTGRNDGAVAERGNADGILAETLFDDNFMMTAGAADAGSSRAVDAPGQAASGRNDDELAQDAATTRFNEVDLNELDAMLDDMLASAPASGPTSTPAAQAAEPASGVFEPTQPAPVLQPASPPQPDPILQPASAALHDIKVDIAALRADVEDLKKRTAFLLPAEAAHAPSRSDISAMLQSHADSIEAQTARMAELEKKTASLLSEGADLAPSRSDISAMLQSHADSIEAQTVRMAELEKKTASLLSEEAAPAPSRSDISAMLQSHADSIEAQTARMAELENLLAANSLKKEERDEKLDEIAVFAKRMADFEERLSTMTRQFVDFSANIDTIAAEAAARVIREEIVALLSEGEHQDG